MEALGWAGDTTPPALVHEGSVSVAIGGTVTIPESQLQFDDNVSAHAQETYTVIAAPADGTLLKNGAVTSSFTQADIDSDLISYHETGNGASSDSFTFNVSDAAGNQTTAQIFQFQILDTTPPALVHEGSVSVAIGGTVTIPESQLQFDDNVSAHAQETYTVITAPADGTLLKNGAVTSSFTQADIDNGLISYHETGSGASSDSFTFKVSDAAGNQTAGQIFQFQIADTAPPSLVHEGSLSVAIGGTVTVPESQLQFDDNVSAHAQETYTVITAPADGTLLKNGAVTSSFTQADIDNGLISYHETGNGAASDSFTFNVSDAAGNQTTGQIFQFQILDTTPPSLVHDGSISASPDATVTIPESQLRFDDNVSAHAHETYTVITAPADGTLLDNGTVASSFTQADIDNGLISYHETGSGASSDSFTFKVSDAAGNQTTGQIFQFQIADTTPPAPVHDGSVSVTIGATVAIPEGQLQFDDNVSMHGQESYTVITAPGHGTLLKNGAPTSSFTQADIDNGIVAYRESGSIAASDSFGFEVTDAAGNSTASQQFKFQVSRASFPQNPGNNDEWILSDGQWETSAGPGSHPSGYNVAAVGSWTGSSTDGILWFNPTTGDTDEWQLSNTQWAASVDLGAHPGNYQISGTGKFVGNGIDDVLWTSASGGSVQTDIWELGSNGKWANSVSPGSHPAGYTVAGTGDWTGSGTDGVLWSNASTGDTDEWQLKNGQWSASVDLGRHPGTGWTVAGVGDFFGNGRDDVLWINASGGSVQTDIWQLGSNGQWIASISPGTHPAGYHVVGIGDFNGDGTSDILWQNATSGDVDEWLIKNGQWAGSVDLGTHPGNFQIAGVGSFTGNGTSDILWHSNS